MASKGWGMRLAACLLLLAAIVFPSCSCEDDEGGGEVVLQWDEPGHQYRVTVTLNPHPDRERTDLPVLAAFSHPEAFIERDVKIYEITGSMASTPVAGDAWHQPDGGAFEVGFTAAGSTPAGEERSFWIYYNVAAEPAAWRWAADDWASFELQDKDADSEDDGFRIEGGAYALQREINPADGTLRSGRRSDGDTALEHLPQSLELVEGFTVQYQLESLTETYPTASAESEPFDAIITDGTSACAAVCVAWQGRAEPVVHDLHLTYRLFAQWPLVETVITAAVPDVTNEYRFSSADWNGRTLFMTDPWDSMVSDTRGDEALETVWDTSMRWLVIYDSSSDRGFGWFLTDDGVVRANSNDDGLSVHDSYGYSAGATATFRYLWMASETKDEIVQLFDDMVPGVEVSDPENRDLNIVEPEEDDFFFPEDMLSVLITTPGNPQPVVATLRPPGASELPLPLQNTADPLRWVSAAPYLFDEADPEGTWTVTAQSAGQSAQVSFEFRLPEHPKLLFDAAELPAIVSRKDDSAYAEIWSAMLSQAGSYDPPIEDPGPGRDIRSYANRLINLALIQLVDPGQPFDALLWDYFFTMLRYPNWDDDAPEPFNNLDLTVGHFLTALAITYDWHYDRLTPEERAELRDRLRSVTNSWLVSHWMSIYRDIDWTHYGTVTNNHYWINHEGVAAAAFVLADEIPESERAKWVDHLEENLAIILSVLEDDGTSHEGVAYHSYGQINLFPWLDMRDRAFGENTAEAIPWFQESVLYDTYSRLPGGDDNYGGVANFGDCPPRHYNPPRTINAWLARRLNDGLAQWSAEHLDWLHVTPYSYLWYDPAITAEAPSSLPTWHLFPNKGIFAWRSSWDDAATYFSLKSGSYFGGHEHPDAGHFILHRAGVPYLTDHGYSYLKDTGEHNLVLVDGMGQFGEGSQWMERVDPVNWAQVDSALGDAAYFDLVADPTAMVQAETLDSWKREVIGLGPDIFLVEDILAGSAAMSLEWLLHSHASIPPTSINHTYTYKEVRTENPWSELATGHWVTQPQPAAASLHVHDASFATWGATIEPSMFVPEQHLDEGGYNESLESYQVGFRLRRSASATQIRSTVALWFGDALAAETWSTAAAEALRLYDGGTEVVQVLWPTGGSVIGFHDFDVTAEMAGRRFDEPATFGRQVTQLDWQGTELIDATQPLDLFARLEHSPSSTDPLRVVAEAAAETSVTLHCPGQPTTVLMDGAQTTFNWTSSRLTLTVPAGQHRFVVE